MAAASFSGNEETDISGQLSAMDPNADPITYAVVTNPAHGTLPAFTAAGAFTYRPGTNYFGTDSFVVSASDGHGGSVNATMTVNVANVYDAPVAANDRIQVANAPVLKVDVLANDANADHEALTLTITEQALVGIAAVNADNTVSLVDIPAGFKGLTRFRYRISDAAGTISDAIANVFVDTPPFRAVLMTGPATGTRVAISDFTGEPRVLDPAEPAGFAVQGFRPSANGEVVFYQRANATAITNLIQLCTVHTAPGSEPQCYQVPDALNVNPPLGSQTAVSYMTSPNGRWAYAVLTRRDSTFAPSLYIFDTNNPTVPTNVAVAGAEHAVSPKFTADSQYLFFIGSDALANDGLAIYRLALGTAQAPMRITAPENPASRIDGYSISPDGSRVVFQRASGDVGLWYVDPAAPGVEHRLSNSLSADENLQNLGGYDAFANPSVTTAAYVVRRVDNTQDIWMAEVSATAPAPHVVANIPSTNNLGLQPTVRPDGGALIYGLSAASGIDHEYFEVTKTPATPTPVGPAVYAAYDSTGNNFLMIDVQLTKIYQVIYNWRTLSRANLGSPATALGTPGLLSSTSGDIPYNAHGAVLLGESADGLSNLQPVLVNLAAPDSPLLLSSETLQNAIEGTPYWLVD